MRRLARHRGFTLVELAVVVVIVGVLAVLGLVGYSKYRASARMTEATNLTTGIRSAQEAYKAERGIYANVSNDINSFYPATSPGKFVTAWGGPCTTCVAPDAWKRLNVTPDTPVMFGYATVSGVGAALGAVGKPTGNGPDIASPSGAAVTALGTATPFYVTVAWGDSDADGTPAMVVSYSVSNQIFMQQE